MPEVIELTGQVGVEDLPNGGKLIFVVTAPGKMYRLPLPEKESVEHVLKQLQGFEIFAPSDMPKSGPMPGMPGGPPMRKNGR